MNRLHLLLSCLLAAVLATLAASEPTVAFNGWSNTPGYREGVMTTRPIDTTAPVPPMGYVEYLPKGYNAADPAVRWPLVIYLAGIGEKGDGTNADGQLYTKMTKHGPLYQVRYFNWDFPAVIIAPQTASTWGSPAAVKRMADYAQANYRIDANRVGMTGLCDGATGTLIFATTYPTYLAGIMPIEATFSPTSTQASAIRNLPMWIAHCFADPGYNRNYSINWTNLASTAENGLASDCMATYPGYGDTRYHYAVDAGTDGKPLNPNGPTYAIANSTATSGGKTVTFGGPVGSSTAVMWSGTDLRPFALAKIGGGTYVASGASLTALNLTTPFVGATGAYTLTMQTPVGYVNTAYRVGTTNTWTWLREQPWDTTRPGKRIFTMFWQQDHTYGWRATWGNGSCWDWLFSQARAGAQSAPLITAQPQNISVVPGQQATFVVGATGTAPLTFAWLRDGTAISGATAATYTSPAVGLTDDGALFAVRVSNALGSVLSASARLTVTAPAVALNEFGDHQVFQRDLGGTSRLIAFTGTYTGTPHVIQVRLVAFTGGAEVTPWTTIATGPGGGSFSGSLTVPQGGWYRTEVRSTDVALVPLATATTTRRWGVGVNILCIGQSNMYGWGSTTYTAANDRVGLLKPASPWAPMVDPWLNNGKASCGPALGNTLVAALNIPVGLVPIPILGSSMVGSTGNAYAYRNPGNHADATTVYGAALGRALAAGGVEFIAMSQGATEAVMATPPTAEEYVAATRLMKANFAEDLPDGGRVGLVYSQVGRMLSSGSYDLGYNRIREAQRLLDDGNGVLLAGSTLDLVIADTVSHYDQAGQDTHGRRLARAILYHLGLRPVYGGPRIASLHFADGARSLIRVQVEHRGGSDLTPATAIPGFVVSDALGTKTIAVSQAASDALDIVCTTPCSGPTSLTYLAGKIPAGPLGLLHDNQADPEPLQAATLALPVVETGEPTITYQPQAVNVTVGAQVSFSVQASGALPLAYQWYRGCTAIDGATNALLAFTAASGDDGAVFAVNVSNALGSVLSDPATLTVRPADVLTAETSAYLARIATAGGTIDATETAAVDSLVRGLQTAGLWTRFHRLNLLTGDAAAAKVPLIRQGGSAVDAWNGGVAYDRDLGAVLNGSSAYIAPGATPAELFASNANLHLGAFATVGGPGGTSCYYAGGGTSSGRYGLRYVKGNVLALHGGAADCTAQTRGVHLTVPDGHIAFHLTRANQAYGYLSSALICSDTAFTIAPLQTQLINVGAYNSFGVASEFMNATIAAYHFGEGLTQPQNTQLYELLQTFLQATGREQRLAAWGDSLTAAGTSDWLARLMAGTYPYRTAYNGGIGEETSAQILARFTAVPTYHGWNTLIWMGRNDFTPATPDTTALLARFASMTASLGHGRYRVLEILPKEDPLEYLGGTKRPALDAANASLAATYGARFIHLLPYLQAANNGSAGDLLDVQHGVVPRSLRVDATLLTQGAISGNAVVLERIRQSVVPGWDPPLPGGGG